MGIQELPQATVRILGASQALTDPAAVVKELLDNALDAHATSISIEIHNNTLDLIQVRDNGQGIPPGDRHLVARPHCTSKITSEADLERIGGSSLGFRGEALASVAGMSGSLTIHTRVDGEQVAASLKINQQGEVITQDRTSTPVGTTVRITDFIKSNPVRRQFALKSTEKTLKKVRQTLHAYGLARPQVRLSFRILKAKNDKGNWMYASKPGGNVEDAAFKIVGAACASQCVWSTVKEHGLMILQAFLPRQDAEKAKVSNIGPFLSVDGRPMASTAGTTKQFVKAFRSALQSAGSNLHGCKDLFMFLNIQCESTTYDANIEPAKDDVLFEDLDAVIRVAERLFATVYSSQRESEMNVRLPANAPLANDRGSSSHVEELRFDLTADDSTSPRISEPLYLAEEGQRRPTVATTPDGVPLDYRSNMYGCDEEDVDVFDDRPSDGGMEAELDELRQIKKNINLSNPWTMAKLNSSRRDSAMDAGASSKIHIPPATRSNVNAAVYPTPRASSQTPPQSSELEGSGILSGDLSGNDGRAIHPFEPPRLLRHQQLQLPSYTKHGIRSMSPPIRPTTHDHTLSSQFESAGTPLSAIPVAGRHIMRKELRPLRQNNKPLHLSRPEQPEREKVWFDHLETFEKRFTSRRKNKPTSTTGLVTQDELGELLHDPRPLTPPRRNRDMRDFVTSIEHQSHDPHWTTLQSTHSAIPTAPFETRPRSAQPSDQRNESQTPFEDIRGIISASGLVTLEALMQNHNNHLHQPLKRRRTGDDHALRHVSNNVRRGGGDDDASCLAEIGGQTASKRRKSADSKIASRRKSSRLPLEHTPAGQRTYALVLKVQTCEGSIATRAVNYGRSNPLLSWHEPSIVHHDTFATIKDPRLVSRLGSDLKHLIINRISDGEMVQDLSQLVQAALAERLEHPLI